MIDFEKHFFEVAPWMQEVMMAAKSLNGGSFNRGRTGWINRGIPNPETIYEHSCKVALASWYLFGTKEAVDMGGVHDFPELLEPDHIPGEISLDEKSRRETVAMMQIRKMLSAGSYWFSVWENYESRIGIAKYVAELDKICPAIQALDYLKHYPNDNLGEFYPYSRSKIKTPVLIELLDDMQRITIPQDKSAYELYFDRLKAIKL